MQVRRIARLRVGIEHAGTAVSAVSALPAISTVSAVPAISAISAQSVRTAVRAAVSRKGRGAAPATELELWIVEQQPEKLEFAAVVEQPIVEQHSV
jgi:hypothetical protein